MKLYTHPRSPFARKVMIFARVHDITLDEHVVGDPDPRHGYTGGHKIAVSALLKNGIIPLETALRRQICT